MIIALPCAAGFSILAKPILNLLYLGDEDAIGAAGCLAILGIGVIFMGTIQCVTGSLQGIGRQLIPVRNLAIGIVFKIVITYFCVGIPSINIHGAALGTVTAYLIAATLNLIAIKKYTGVKFDAVATFIRPFATALTMAVVTWGSYTLLAEPVGMKLAVCISIVLSCGVYAVALFIFKAITREDLTKLPKGQQLAGIYDRVMRVRR